MSAMFDPVYVTEVLNDILGRRGLQVTLIPKDSAGPLPEQPDSPSARRKKQAASTVAAKNLAQ